MKKITTLLILTIISFCFTTSAEAQRIRFGIKGGVNLSESNLKNISDVGIAETYTGYNAGIVLNLRLLLGFSIQPELIYTQSGMKYIEEILPSEADRIMTISQGSIELPVNIQWGIKLGPVRPFLQVSPYIGYSVFSKSGIVGSSSNKIEDLDKFQYGIGLGFGLDVWKFQVAYRYKWDLKAFDINSTIASIPLGDAKIRGSEITLGFFF